MKNIELWQGDCLELMKRIPNNSVDMIFADLPYGKTIQKWDEVINFDLLWMEYERIRKPKCPVVLFGAEPFSSLLRTSNLSNFKYDWVWHKSKPSGMAMAKKQPMRNHEIISVFYDNNFYPIKEKREGFTEKSVKRFSGNQNLGTYKNHGDSITGLGSTELKKIETLRNPTTIKRFGSLKNRLGKNFHPTQKPVEMLEYFILTYTQEGDVVLDNTMGSGSTMVACKHTNRKSIGIEREKKYFDIAVERVENE